jgi:hypothetical protein
MQSHHDEKQREVVLPAAVDTSLATSPEPKKAGEYSHIHPFARVWGVVLSATIEAFATYPLDVLKNREMLSSKIKRLAQVAETTFENQQQQTRARALRHHLLQHIVGPEHVSLNFRNSADIQKALKLSYRGSSAYWAYKVVNRGFKFGLQQPLMESMMDTPLFAQFANFAGYDFAKVLIATLAGSATGIAEVVINPIDRWKLLCQKHHISLGVAFQIMRKEGIPAQYAAWSETMARNAIGTGTLCFGKYATYYAMGVSDHNKPTWKQSLISSFVGNGAMIVASHPFDLLKVRKQLAEKPAETTEVTHPSQHNLSLKRGMVGTLFHIGKTEGMYALLAGLPAKLVGSGLKGTLIMMACEMLVKEINSHFALPTATNEISAVPKMSH